MENILKLVLGSAFIIFVAYLGYQVYAQASSDTYVRLSKDLAEVKAGNQIVAEANEEARRIKDRAEKEIELEKSKARDDLKQEVISVAGAIAGKFVKSELDANAQAALIDSAINEMGENTWQN